MAVTRGGPGDVDGKGACHLTALTKDKSAQCHAYTWRREGGRSYFPGASSGAGNGEGTPARAGNLTGPCLWRNHHASRRSGR